MSTIHLSKKEIDAKLLHFKEELDWGAELLRKIDNVIHTEKDESIIPLHRIHRLKIEFFCFTSTSYIDHLCAFKNLKRSKTDWEKFYNTKNAYLIIYETINTFHKYKGELYKITQNESEEIYPRFFRMLNDELSEFKDNYNYDNEMAKIRNKSTAHYDKAFLQYYESYNLIDKSKSKVIIREFLYFLNPLHYFAYSLLIGEVDQFLFVNSWMS
jgi:hypothetical protein